MEPDMEELFRQGRELHNQWQIAEQKVRWCEQHMVTLDQHERAQAEVRLLDEQAAEIMLREQHSRFAALVSKAMEEREQAIKAGQPAQEEAQRATHELQRVCNDATAHVQKQDNLNLHHQNPYLYQYHWGCHKLRHHYCNHRLARQHRHSHRLHRHNCRPRLDLHQDPLLDHSLNWLH
jgi:DNA repair exonuclease SbcCD ATPase subunit